MSAVPNLPVPATRSAEDLTALAAAINGAHARFFTGLQAAAECGRLLVRAKRTVPHGKWLAWLEKNCPSIGARQAQKYMRVSKEILPNANWNAHSGKTSIDVFLDELSRHQPSPEGDGAEADQEEPSADAGEPEEPEDEEPDPDPDPSPSPLAIYRPSSAPPTPAPRPIAVPGTVTVTHPDGTSEHVRVTRTPHVPTPAQIPPNPRHEALERAGLPHALRRDPEVVGRCGDVWVFVRTRGSWSDEVSVRWVTPIEVREREVAFADVRDFFSETFGTSVEQVQWIARAELDATTVYRAGREEGTS